MKSRIIFLKWQPDRETVYSFLIFFLSVFVNGLAHAFSGTDFFFLFYQGLFILGVCIFLPLWYMSKTNQTLESMGISFTNWKKAVIYGGIFVVFSMYGRFMGTSVVWPEFNQLIMLIGALLLASLFEEIFFRGFLQTRFEKAFGVIPAVVLSGLTFSLYHLGYPDYRNVQVLTVLFLFGLFLAITFQFTKNVLTSFIVNLPHAVITFIENQDFFNQFSMIISLITTLIIIFIISKFKKLQQ
jgi:uncharacterized protein